MFSEACNNFTYHTFKYENETYIHDQELECAVSKTVLVLFSLIGIAGLIGNAMVVLVVLSNPMMRSTTNILIINLAIADLLFVIFCVPSTGIDYVLASWPFGNLWCKFNQYMIVVTCHGSVYTLVLMSLDRFLAVVHPISSISIRTQWNALLSIIVTWLIVTISAIPVGLSHGIVEYYNHKNEINIQCHFLEEYNHAAFQISFFLSSYIVPLTLISILYVGMLIRLWHSVPGSKVSAESRRGKKRVTRMVVFVVLAFAVCWLPVHVVLVLKSLQMLESTRLTVSIQIISHVVAYTNLCIANPILYNCFSENFRKAFVKIVWCGTPKPLVQQPSTTKAGGTTRTTTAQNGGVSPPEGEFL